MPDVAVRSSKIGQRGYLPLLPPWFGERHRAQIEDLARDRTR